MRKLLFVGALLSLFLGFSACKKKTDPSPIDSTPIEKPEPSTPEPTTLAEVFNELAKDETDAGLSEFAAILDTDPGKSVKDSLASTTEEYTLFAPNNAAVRAFYKSLSGLETVDVSATDIDLAYMTVLAQTHLVKGKVPSADLVADASFETIIPADQEGETAAANADKFKVSVAVDSDGNSVLLNDTKVVTADIDTPKGALHVVDKVMLLQLFKGLRGTAEIAIEFLAKYEKFNNITAESGLSTGDLAALGNKTWFIPSKLPSDMDTDEEIAELSSERAKAFLFFHIIEGKKAKSDLVAMMTNPVNTLLDKVDGTTGKEAWIISTSDDITTISGKQGISGKITTFDRKYINGIIHEVDSYVEHRQGTIIGG